MWHWGFTTASMTLIPLGGKASMETKNLVKQEATKKCYLTIYTTIIYTVIYTLIYLIILHFITVTVHLKNPDLQMLTVSTILYPSFHRGLVELVTLVTLVELVAPCRVRTAPAGSIAWCWLFEAIQLVLVVCQELEGSLQTQYQCCGPCGMPCFSHSCIRGLPLLIDRWLSPTKHMSPRPVVHSRRQAIQMMSHALETMASTAKLPAARDSNLFVVVVNPKCGCGQEEHFTVHQKCMDPLRSNDIPLKPCDRISTVPTWGFLLSLPQYQGIPRVPTCSHEVPA